MKVVKVLFLIFILALAGFAIYKFFPYFSAKEETQGEEVQEIEPEAAEEFIEETQEIRLEATEEEIAEELGIGSFAPDFAWEDAYGNQGALSNFRGRKPVLLVFWATWCGFCAKELPDLKLFVQEYQSEIEIIAISSGESKEAVSDYIQKNNINFSMILDENRKIWNQYLVRGTPTHFFINKEGKIALFRYGLASKDDLETMLAMLNSED